MVDKKVGENGLTFRGKRLIGELRRLREAAGLSQDQVGRQLGWHFTRVSRIERGVSAVSPADTARLLDLFGVSAAVRDPLVQLARDAAVTGWWAAYGDVFTGSYIDMEDAATTIQDWELSGVPGLLQTSAYARAFIRTGTPDAPEQEIEQRVRARMARKPLLERDDPPAMQAVLDEAIFRRVPVDREVMGGQIRALLDVPSNVTVQVLPFAAGLHAGVGGSIVVLRFPELLSPPKAYAEGPGGDTYVESIQGVKRCIFVFEAAQRAALSPEDSTAWLAKLAEEYR